MNTPRPSSRTNGHGSDVVREAESIMLKNIGSPARRAFLRGSLTLGGLAMLTGCSVTEDEHVESALASVSRFNDRVQGWLFNPNRLAPTYPESLITRPFPFNAYYDESEVRNIDGGDWRLEVSGLVADRRPWTLQALRAMYQQDQVTRHVCVEGWSAIGKWGGVPFAHFLRRIGADTTARYVGSSALMTTTRASTWPRHCIRRPFSH